jgi:hypothetical protein
LQTILIIAIACSLAGCVTQQDKGDFITIKPSAAQIESAVRTVVCDAFKPLRYSGAKDTKETIAQARENNAALRSFNCPK